MLYKITFETAAYYESLQCGEMVRNRKRKSLIVSEENVIDMIQQILNYDNYDNNVGVGIVNVQEYNEWAVYDD